MELRDRIALFADNNTSLFMVRQLMEDLGYTREEFAACLTDLLDEPNYELRVGSYHKDEWQADLYLTVSQSV